MAFFWTRPARKLSAGRVVSTGSQQVSGFFRSVIAPEECSQHFKRLLASSSQALRFCRHEEQNLGFSSSREKLLGSRSYGDLSPWLGRHRKGLLALASVSPLQGSAFNSAGGAFLILGFSALALCLGAEFCHAEDQDLNLRAQPEGKSNIHTAKWRIFTDKARDLYSQGSFDSAEKFFYKALEEAKLGFGDNDPHVASSYNNLAELFRMKKEYDKAEPYYLEAVNRLRQSSGVESGSVGFTLHNLGGFYLLQRKLEQARSCYEEALRIKGRALGLDHPEYANTMFHLGEVIRLQGDVNDGLALIQDSVRIIEQNGLGSTRLAVNRLTRLSELLVFSGQLAEAETVQRKVLQVLEFSKDFVPKDTVAALENLSSTLEKQGKVDECEALLEKSLRIRREGNIEDDVHAAASLLKLGEISFRRGKSAVDRSQALASYDKAEGLLLEAVKIAELHCKEGLAMQRRSGKAGAAPFLLAHCLVMLGDLRIHKLDRLADKDSAWKLCIHAEMVLRRAMSYLENILVQQGDKATSEVRKLYQECSGNLADVSKRKRDLQSERRS